MGKKLHKNHTVRSPYEPQEQNDGTDRFSRGGNRNEKAEKKAAPKKKAAKKKAAK